MKQLALYKQHTALGAKMGAFAGFDMPLTYKGVKAEHLCVREHVGVFDVSHMGEFIVSGDAALDLLQYTTSNNVTALDVGAAQYGYMPNDSGGVVDDLLIYRLEEKRYMLVVNASTNMRAKISEMDKGIGYYHVRVLSKDKNWYEDVLH